MMDTNSPSSRLNVTSCTATNSPPGVGNVLPNRLSSNTRLMWNSLLRASSRCGRSVLTHAHGALDVDGLQVRQPAFWIELGTRTESNWRLIGVRGAHPQL